MTEIKISKQIFKCHQKKYISITEKPEVLVFQNLSKLNFNQTKRTTYLGKSSENKKQINTTDGIRNLTIYLQILIQCSFYTVGIKR